MKLDAVDVGIMWDRLVAISDEIVTTLVRTSFSTIVREARAFIRALQADGKEVMILCVGRKGRAQLGRDFGSGWGVAEKQDGRKAA